MKTRVDTTATPGAEIAVRRAARSVDQLREPGATSERYIRGVRAGGRDFAIVLDVAQVPDVSSHTFLSVVTTDAVPVVVASGRGAASVGADDPDDPPTPYFKGHGSTQQICLPEHDVTVYDEDCEAKKAAAQLAATAICVSGGAVGAFFGPFGAAAAIVVCEAAHIAADSIECVVHIVTIPEACRNIYPTQTEPQRQQARETYHDHTGQYPPDDPCEETAPSFQGSAGIKRSPICRE